MDFLERFTKKPIPKKQAQILVPGAVTIKTEIIDKTDSGFDANAFRQKLKQFQLVAAKEEPVIEETIIQEPEPPTKEVSPEISKTVVPVTKIPKPVDIPKKTGEKRKVEEEEGPPEEGDLSIIIDKRGRSIQQRLPPPPTKILLKSSSYYLNNRKKFIEFITSLFLPYRQELTAEESKISCDRPEGTFSLLTHQKIVRDYINEYTPYRGVLIYH